MKGGIQLIEPHACSIVPAEDLALFKKIERVVQRMPEIDLGEDEKGEKILVSCHMLARAFARSFPVDCQDGYFGDSCEHSWLVTKNGLVIDVYPVAVVGGPILVDRVYITPWCYLYKEDSLSKLNDARFQEHVHKVTEVVRQTMAKLKM